MPQEIRYIFIADRDDKNTNEKFSTKEISIEHLYKDKEIKTEYEINGIKRRLYNR